MTALCEFMYMSVWRHVLHLLSFLPAAMISLHHAILVFPPFTSASFILSTSVSLFLRAMERSSEVLHSCLCHFCGLQLVVWFQLHSHKNEHRQVWLQQRWWNAPSPNSPSTFSVDLFILVSFHFPFCVSPFSNTSLHYMLFDVWGWCCLFLTTLDWYNTPVFDLSGSLLCSGPDVFLWSLWVSTLH